MATNYTLKAGYVMTVTAGVTKASVQDSTGALCIDTTNADVYRNDGTAAAPVWVKVGDAP